MFNCIMAVDAREAKQSRHKQPASFTWNAAWIYGVAVVPVPVNYIRTCNALIIVRRKRRECAGFAPDAIEAHKCWVHDWTESRYHLSDWSVFIPNGTRRTRNQEDSNL